jgi:lipid A 3-O-deacylase
MFPDFGAPVRHRRAMRTLIVSLLLAAAFAPYARADDIPRWSILEENDSLYFNSDKHYTQGLRVSRLGPDLTSDSFWTPWYDAVGTIPDVFAPDAMNARRVAIFGGQSLFTPKNLQLTDPSTHDRPYGGWLYAGLSLLQENNHAALENFEIDLGAVGPVALGEQTQNTFHNFINDQTAKGWSHQIQNEPGLMLTYERLWRYSPGDNGIFDIVPQAGITAGNVFTYGAIGAQIRLGHNLNAEYGPVRIRPGLSGTDYFDANQFDGNWGYYFFAGAQGRVVAQNIFLDGNTFRVSPHVDKKPLVADLQAGFTVIWPWYKIRTDFSVVRRTEEFYGQATPDEIGTAALSWSW